MIEFKRKQYYKFLIILMGFLFPNIINGQIPKQEKRIYLLDVTASMRGQDDEGAIDIMDTVRSQLSKAIRNLRSDKGEVVIIPFTNITHTPIRGSLLNKDSIADVIDLIDIKKGDTNIAAAWEKGVEELDSTKINYMFLLTDGIHNTGVSKEQLFENLREWGDISKNKYFFGFYVMLTPNARDLEITKIAEETEQIWGIESMDVNVEFVTLPLRSQANNYKNPNLRFNFKPLPIEESDDVKIVMEENPYYELTGYDANLKEGYIKFRIDEKGDLQKIPVEETIRLHFSHDREKHPLLFFVPESINLRLVNRGPRTMSIRMKR